MADEQQTETPDYVRGYRDGLAAGFDQAVLARTNVRQGPTNAQKVGALFILGAGLVGAAGIVLSSRKEGVPLGTTVIVSSSIFTSVIVSLKVLTGGQSL